MARTKWEPLQRAMLHVALWLGALSLIGYAGRAALGSPPVLVPAQTVAVAGIFAIIGVVVFLGLGVSALVNLVRVVVRVVRMPDGPPQGNAQ